LDVFSNKLAIGFRSAFLSPVKGGRHIETRGFPVSFLVLAIAVSAALFGPAAAASADTFTVDSVGDAPKAPAGAICEAAAGECTLRAAIEAADQNPDFDTVAFDSAEFPGDVSGTIEPNSALPAITAPMTIDGQCPPRQFGEFPYGTCVGLNAAGLAHGFLVEADEVTIRGIAVTGATFGIDVVNSADEFAARNDVLGANLAEESGPNGTGILLGPGVDEAQIGTYADNGTSGHDQFVGNTEVGLDLEGASHALIRNNDFGATPAPNGTDIEISGVSTGGRKVEATDNEIGAKKSSFGEHSSGCSEGCNVISGAVDDGIDLAGEGADQLPASGSTIIRGNVIGAEADGETAEANGRTGVAVGSAGGFYSEVTIGGPLAASEGNEFVGGSWSVTAGPEERGLVIEGNFVGRATGEHGVLLEAPSEGAFSLDTLNQAGDDTLPEVVGNELFMNGGVGVLDVDMGARITENRIDGADTAVLVEGERMWWGAYIEDNEIGFPGEYGVVLDNWSNLVTGNLIFGATKAGILVESPGWTGGTDDIIGGPPGEIPREEWSEENWWRWEKEALENEEEENEIDDSGGPAIEVVGEHTAFVDALRNYGHGNAGPFVDLGGDGPGNQPDGPNKGIQAPTIVSATQAEVSGVDALPGGTSVMVFLKATSSPGEIEELLGSAHAEEDGHWYLELPEGLPVGTPIAVDQFNGERGSSEMAFATLAPGPKVAPPVVEAEKTSESELADAAPGDTQTGPRTHSPRATTTSPSTTSPSPVVKPSTPPSARILARPPGSSSHARAAFKFTASTAGARFECELDGAKWARCGSSKTYGRLKVGRHTFRVRALQDGLSGPVTKYQFTIKG
jgi:CSLREA domain-containing protein